MARRKKRFKNRRRIFVLIFFVSVLTWAYFKWKMPVNSFVKYEEFGIPIPENFSIHGIDVSRFQQRIAWEDVKEMKVKKIKMGFAFIKATEGISNIDPQFKRNWKKSKEAGMIRGAYHFFIASKDGRMQAENFIKNVDLDKNDLPPVVDIEKMGRSNIKNLKKELKVCLSTLEAHYKVKPVIYTYVDFYTRNLGKEFDDYPLWAAHYFQYTEPRINRNWAFWQHSENGRVNGISSKVDFNVFNGDSTEFRKFLID